MSSDKNYWTYDDDVIGVFYMRFLVGYTSFGILYLSAIIILMYDIRSKMKEYDEAIEEDKEELKALDFDFESEDCKEQLAFKLSGEKKDLVLDD